MAVYRYIHVSFWEDTKVQDEMTPIDRYFMLYLLTNPHSNQVGVFEISKRQISNEIGYDVETVEKLLLKFENDFNIIKYDNSTKELMILNWYKYNWTTSGKVKSCIEKEMKKIKSEKFLDYLYRVCIPYIYPNDTPPNKNEPLSNKEKEKEKEKEKQKEKKEEKENIKTDDSCADGLVDIIEFYENNIGLITPYSKEILEDFHKEMSADVIIFALKEAVEADVRTIKYIKAILNSWSKKGIKTVLEAKKETEEFNKNKNNIDTKAKEEFLNDES